MNRFQHAATTALNAERFPTRQPTRALEHCCYPEHGITPDRILGRNRMDDVQHAFVYRHAAADSEDEHAYDERPEVKLMPVSERMISIRGLAALEDPEQHQATVAGVDRRMNRFGEHGRTAGKRSRDKLGHGNREISRNGRINSELRFWYSLFCAHHRSHKKAQKN